MNANGVSFHNTYTLKREEIAAVIVLYHPDDSVIDNLKSYMHQVDIIWAIDNTEEKQINTPLIKELIRNDRIIYIPNNENLGIAKALNIGAQCALKSGYNYLLTMDQDSTASPNMVATLLAYGSVDDPHFGILSPFHSIAVQAAPLSMEPNCQQVLTAWTSGSLLNLNAYKQVGPFNNDYFIDFVDHEYCMRLNLAGYRIYKVNKAILKHNIGTDIQKRRLLWLELIVSNHSPLRRYYITRNRLRLASDMNRWFPSFFWDDKKKMLAEVLTILFFEKERMKKISMMLQGVLDYIRNVLGKYPR